MTDLEAWYHNFFMIFYCMFAIDEFISLHGISEMFRIYQISR